MRLKCCLIVLLILITPVFAEGEEVPVAPNETSIDLNLPPSLSGSKVTLSGLDGSPIGEVAIDPTGQGRLTLPTPGSYSVRLTGQEVKEAEKEEEIVITPVHLVLTGVITFLITGVLFFILGRLSVVKILNELREVVFDEEMD